MEEDLRDEEVSRGLEEEGDGAVFVRIMQEK